MPTTLLLIVCYLSCKLESGLLNHKSIPCCCSQCHVKHSTFESQLTSHLLLIMKGIHKLTRISKPPRIRLPITSDILQWINTVISAEPDSYFNKMMWTACYLAFISQVSSQYPLNITVTLKYTCHSQMSHWIEETFPLWYVHTICSAKLTLFGETHTFIWAKLTSRFVH